MIKPILTRFDQIDPQVLQDLATWIGQSNLNIPITSVLGFSQFTAQNAPFIVTAETTASGAYTDLATVGPTLTGLPGGMYLIMFGAVANNSGAGNQTYMSVQANSTAAVDADSCETSSATHQSIMMAVAKSLPVGNNTVTAKYRVAAGTGNFFNRWLLALRYANP